MFTISNFSFFLSFFFFGVKFFYSIFLKMILLCFGLDFEDCWEILLLNLWGGFGSFWFVCIGSTWIPCFWVRDLWILGLQGQRFGNLVLRSLCGRNGCRGLLKIYGIARYWFIFFIIFFYRSLLCWSSNSCEGYLEKYEWGGRGGYCFGCFLRCWSGRWCSFFKDFIGNDYCDFSFTEFE